MNAMLPTSLVVLLTMVPVAMISAADFALRDGDTVVFLGDSITAARSYGKMIENYSLLRFLSGRCGSSMRGSAATRRPVA